MSQRTKIGLAFGLLTAAVIITWLSQPRQVNRAGIQVSPAFERAQHWFARRVTDWEASGFTEIGNRDLLRKSISEWIEYRISTAAEFDIAALVDAIELYVHRLSSLPSPETDSAAAHREWLTDIRNENYVQARFEELTGRAIDRKLAASDVAALFRKGHTASAGPIVAVGRKALLEVELSKRIEIRADDTALSLFQRALPDFRFWSLPDLDERWEPPHVQAAIPLTRPRRGFADVLRAQPRLPVCQVRFVARTADGTCGLVDFVLFYSPLSTVWELDSVALRLPKPAFWYY